MIPVSFLQDGPSTYGMVIKTYLEFITSRSDDIFHSFIPCAALYSLVLYFLLVATWRLCTVMQFLLKDNNVVFILIEEESNSL